MYMISYISSIIKKLASLVLNKELATLKSSIVASEVEATRCIKSMEASRQYATAMEERADKLEQEVHQLSQQLANPARVIRLSRNVYKEFCKGFPQSVITGQTTDLQAAALVGQHTVLDKLERELVVD